MAYQLSVAARNALLDAIETVIGVSAVLKLRTGSQPATCASADAGIALATIMLPSDWWSTAAAGVKSKLGTWSVAAGATGTVDHFRLYASDGVTCHIQGLVTITGGGGNMTVDNTDIAVGQIVTITQFDMIAPNA